MVGESVICVAAPAMALSPPDGQVGGSVLDGFYHSDRRLIGRLTVTVDGREPEPIRHRLLGATTAEFTAVHRTPFDHVTGHEATVTRVRDATALSETITVRNLSRRTLTCEVGVTTGTDLAELSQVRSGRAHGDLPAVPVRDGVRFTCDDGTTATLTATPGPGRIDPHSAILTWPISLEPGGHWTLRLDVITTRPAAGPVTGARGFVAAGVPWTRPRLCTDDTRLVGWWEQSLADLEALLLADAGHPADVFAAAGAPWYLTLFGRDALWTARMLLALGTDVAAGTLRTLARRQGTRYDPVSEEAPGKIVHEVRRTAHSPYAGLILPPLYYGTIDASPLFVSLLAEAWRWGLPDDEVAGLLPAAEAALGWLKTDGDPDEDGFVEYAGSGGTGLANQGWKDSPDAIQFADGTQAKPPIALAEVQGYAYQAARDGADLLAAFGRPGATAWHAYADRLADRFRRHFWIDDPAGPYVAIALDGGKRPVDGVTSNMGHLLATGILTADEAARVAARLTELDCGRGLRTLAEGRPGFNPLSYHCGSVWAHDTAITVAGLAATGHPALATSLFQGVMRAAPAFGDRLPELWAGRRCAPGEGPLPYPGACRPQAWAAAAPIAMLTALLGIHPDIPARRLTVRPVHPWPLGEIDIHHLTVAGHPLSLHVAADGTPHILTAPLGLTCHVE